MRSLDVPLAGHIERPGLLDGNDVVLAGETAFVGVGARGNALGRGGFAQSRARTAIASSRSPSLPGVPALRAVASAVAKDTVVLAGDKVDRGRIRGFQTIVLERGEEQGAGVLCLDDRHVLADIRYRTALQRCGGRALPSKRSTSTISTKSGSRRRCWRLHFGATDLGGRCASPSSPTFTAISSRSTPAWRTSQSQGGADAIVVAGDLCLDGPKPKKVLQRLEEIGARAYAATPTATSPRIAERQSFDAAEIAQIAWTRRDLGESWLSWLEATCRSRCASAKTTTNCSSFTQIPKTDDEHLWPDADEATLGALIGDERADDDCLRTPAPAVRAHVAR